IARLHRIISHQPVARTVATRKSVLKVENPKTQIIPKSIRSTTSDSSWTGSREGIYGAPTTLQASPPPPMVTRWSQKSPGLKILWIWTLGTAAIVVGGIVRMRVNDVQKILREEEEAAAAATSASSERVLKDEKRRICAAVGAGMHLYRIASQFTLESEENK
ncbi:hypothetical protein U9M48_034163, partial [Paspalum notatum var. saurae]